MKNNTLTERQIIAQTIADQLVQGDGTGFTRIAIMIGARNFIAHEAGLSFKFPQRKRSLPNHCKVTLDASDTYTVEFSRIGKRGLEVTKLASLAGIYAEDLKSTFETTTGLYLSF